MKLSNKYHKILSVCERMGEDRLFIIGAWTNDTIRLLKDIDWEWTEKVDGTNIRVIWEADKFVMDTDIPRVRFAGRGDNAQIPAKLFEHLQKTFTFEKMMEVFGGASEAEGVDVVLYGEGYGARIQKGGGNYKADGNSFVLFDVMIDGIYLERENVIDIAQSLGITAVPIVGSGTLQEAIEFTKKGFNSQWGDFLAEGIVARPRVELLTRRGDRVIVKIKYQDFIKRK